MDFNASLSALGAFSTAQEVTAHNVANVNTEEFKSSRVSLEELPDQSGVRVQEIRKDTSPGPQVQSMRPEQTQAGQMEQVQTTVQASNTDVAREMVSMTVNENAFAANAAVVRTQDEMLGHVVDEMV